MSISKGRKKKGGGKLSRSITVTVRLDPKLRYWVEIAARCQRRTVSSYIEWAVNDSLSSIRLPDGFGGMNNGKSLSEIAEDLWSVDESERLARLAIFQPELLTHEEQLLWKLICDRGLPWKGAYLVGGQRNWDWEILERVVFPELRKHWDLFNDVVNGSADENDLPQWSREILKKTDDIQF
jgi:hypothetical protein